MMYNRIASSRLGKSSPSPEQGTSRESTERLLRQECKHFASIGITIPALQLDDKSDIIIQSRGLKELDSIADDYGAVFELDI